MKTRKVCFSSSAQGTNSQEVTNENAKIDASMMGYDWIAHMVENQSIVQHESDDFFEKIKDFRDTNWEQCTNHVKENKDRKSNLK